MEELTWTNAAYVAIVILALGLGFRWLWKKTAGGSQPVNYHEELDQEKQTDIRQQQVRKGTHDQYGHRLCITCGDKQTRATQPAFVVNQDEGPWDLVKRAFGAPARYTIKQLEKSDKVVNVYCDGCADLMRLEHEEFILRYETKARLFKRDASVELRRWLKFGCNDAVVRLIEEHDEKIKKYEPQPKKATVVPLKTEADGS